MLDGFACVPLSPEEDGVGTGRGAQCELVESEGLAAGVEDALLCGPREAEGGDGEFGDLEEADVVCDCSDEDDCF